MKRLFMQFMKIIKMSSKDKKDQHKVDCQRYVHKTRALQMVLLLSEKQEISTQDKNKVF